MEYYFKKKMQKQKSVFKKNTFPVTAGLLVILILISLTITLFAAGVNEIKRDLQIINPKPEFTLSIDLDKGVGATYLAGERIRLSFRVNAGSYVTLFGYDNLGNVLLIFPNKNQKDAWVQPYQEHYVDYTIDAEKHSGIEYIQGFATKKPILITDEIERRFNRTFMPIIETDINIFSNRIRSILTNLPLTSWSSSEILHYQIIDREVETGQLYISSQPDRARVYIDGNYSGQTPLHIEQLQVGDHSVSIELSGYESWFGNASIIKSKTKFLSADLVPVELYGSIIVKCSEDIARIYLDDQFKRLTHANKEVVLEKINAGFHNVRIVLNGYYDWYEQVEVNPLQKIYLDVQLDKIKQEGSLEITCNVDNASIYLNDELKQKTSAGNSVIIENLLEGNYSLLITKDGFYNYSANIMIYDEFVSHIDVQLHRIEKEKKKGSIVIHSDVSDARVYLNGEYKMSTSAGKGKIIDGLEEGIYEIAILKEGYNTWLGDVVVFEEDTISLFIDLTKKNY